MRKGFNTTREDIAEYESHLPEYSRLFNELTKNKKLIKSEEGWKGMVNGEIVPVNPRQYIIAHSENFVNNGWSYDGVNRGTAMSQDKALETVKDGDMGRGTWTTDDNSQISIFQHERADGPVL